MADMPLCFPPIYLLSTHLSPSELHRLEDAIPSLTYDIQEAAIIVGNISKPERAQFELRRHKVDTRPFVHPTGQISSPSQANSYEVDEDESKEYPRSKRRKVIGKGEESSVASTHKIIKVAKLSWLNDCLAQGVLLPVDGYIIFEGYRSALKGVQSQDGNTAKQLEGILERAAADFQHGQADGPSSRSARLSTSHQPKPLANPPSFTRQTTSELESSLPEVPDFLHTTYSCQRSTPVNSPNNSFINELKDIRTLRILQGDQIGVRAYSTSIATLAAYPYTITNSLEIERLPGCGAKIAEVYQQWHIDGRTAETAEGALNERMSVLKLFYDIWGVGDTTAREFYKKGWRDLDDLVEYGWQSLSRVQQIGVKFYEEFKSKISRPEVEEIANDILAHARAIHSGFEMIIVGGYRRGKTESGDVDVILSHRDEAKTSHAIEKMVLSLEKAHLITHTLSLWTKNSERGQLPLAWRGEKTGFGTGFDTLDKAMVVWQDKDRYGDAALHRRVDIIVSPWKTVGCALLGWSGATTFQRDLRRYCKREKGLKFDSSGIRSRSDGRWIDFESSGTPSRLGPEPAPDMETAERRVFSGLKLTWRPPSERCTG